MRNLSQSICLEFNKNYTFTCKEVIWPLGSGMFEKVVREHVHTLITAD